jgi:hypothetical protein
MFCFPRQKHTAIAALLAVALAIMICLILAQPERLARAAPHRAIDGGSGAGGPVQGAPKLDEPSKTRAEAPANQALLDAVRAAKRASYALLAAPLVDPDKDCKLVKDDATLSLRIEVPGDKVHSLAPEIVSAADKKKPLHNAPMILTEVDGDFAVLVKIPGDFNAGPDLPKDRQGNDEQIVFTFQGAGLVLYQDPNNFVRFERTHGVDPSNRQAIHKLLIEGVRSGKQALRPSYISCLDKETVLALVRKKGKLRFLFSSGDDWLPVKADELDLELPAKIRVGLVASNISARPFTARFEDFALLRDPATIEAVLGDKTDGDQR